MFHATAAEALSSVQGEIEELSVAAEGEYRWDPSSQPNETLTHTPRHVGSLAITEQRS